MKNLVYIWKIIKESLESFYANKIKVVSRYGMERHGWVVVWFHLFLTLALQKDSFRIWPFYPLEEALVPCHYETEWGSEPVSTLWRTENILFLLWIEPRFLGRPAHSQVSMLPAHGVDSSDITSKERPAADINENMNTGNVDTSGAWQAQDEEGYDLETLHRPEPYSLRKNRRAHYSPDTHT